MNSLEDDVTMVRLALSSDEEELMGLCRLSHLESGLDQSLPFCPDKARAQIQKVIVRGRNEPDSNEAVCGVIGGPGALEASIYLKICTHHVSEASFLGEIWSYVFPEFRRADHYDRLDTFARATASALHLPLVTGIMGPQRQQARERFYERKQDCTRLGSVFLRQVGA